MFDRRDYPRACEKFALSRKLDPKVGTMMNLAICYERAGRLASAFAELAEAGSMAGREGRANVVQDAGARARALLARLPRLRLRVDSSVGDVTIDGESLAREGWIAEIPVDPGPHDVGASRAGYRTVVERATATEGEVTEVRLGPLDPLEHEPRATEPVTPRPALKDTSRRTTALAVGATGAGIALVGGAFGLAAIVRRGDAEDACRGGDCHAGETMNRQARTLAWTANVTLATGLIAVAVGIVLYVTSPRSTARAATAFVF